MHMLGSEDFIIMVVASWVVGYLVVRFGTKHGIASALRERDNHRQGGS
jgi:hypothetical protein